MIVNDKVLLKITHKSHKYYKSKGYDVNVGDEVEISISDLPLGSHIKIDIRCDSCGFERKYIYQGYIKYTKNNTIPYYCNKCNSIRIKESFEKRFGEGITNSMHVEEYRNRQRENLNKSLTNEVIENRIKTNNLRYGVNSPCQNEDIKVKLIKSWSLKSTDEIEKINSKREKTCLSIYGFHNINLNQKILNKSKKTRIDNGNQIPDEFLTDFRKYRKQVTSMTNKNKKILLESWNGLDYYDDEYIRDNFSLNKYDKKYPTIDHKYSVLNGFLNNITPNDISKLENLCFTKRTNNSKKSSNNFLSL